MNNFFRTILCLILLSACSSVKESPNTLTKSEKSEGWQLLFDGSTTKGWHIYNKGEVASAWTAANGELTCQTGGEFQHGDLVSDGSYENFDLVFDWKITEGGNSGVFINVVEKPENPTAWASGPEYQLLDFSHQDFEVVTKKTGGIFGFAWQGKELKLEPAGQWNHSRIKQQNGIAEFYLNGILTTRQDFTSEEWKTMIAQTHFKNFPDFGIHGKGHIALQDWAKGISFRNIKIKTL